MGALPVVKLTWADGQAGLWYVDERLREVRKVDDLHEAIPADVVLLATLLGAVKGEIVQPGETSAA